MHWNMTPPELGKGCSAAVNGIEADPGEGEVNPGFEETIGVINSRKSRKAFAEPGTCSAA